MRFLVLKSMKKISLVCLRSVRDTLSTNQVMIDVKPVHVNEPESKGGVTLDREGVQYVVLHTHLSASREHIICMTCCVSDKSMAQASHIPSLACCANISIKLRIGKLNLPKHTNLSPDWTPSGPYDRFLFLSYLRCCSEWCSPERAEANDNRILFVGRGCVPYG